MSPKTKYCAMISFAAFCNQTAQFSCTNFVCDAGLQCQTTWFHMYWDKFLLSRGANCPGPQNSYEGHASLQTRLGHREQSANTDLVLLVLQLRGKKKSTCFRSKTQGCTYKISSYKLSNILMLYFYRSEARKILIEKNQNMK